MPYLVELLHRQNAVDTCGTDTLRNCSAGVSGITSRSSSRTSSAGRSTQALPSMMKKLARARSRREARTTQVNPLRNLFHSAKNLQLTLTCQWKICLVLIIIFSSTSILDRSELNGYPSYARLFKSCFYVKCNSKIEVPSIRSSRVLGCLVNYLPW